MAPDEGVSGSVSTIVDSREDFLKGERKKGGEKIHLSHLLTNVNLVAVQSSFVYIFILVISSEKEASFFQ